MYKKLKIVTQFLGIFLFLTLTNCSRDEYKNQISKSNDINLAQFKKETGLSNFKTKITVSPRQNNQVFRNADGSYELTDFDISSDIIKRTVVDEKITYTFQIKPIDEVLEDSFFNLIMFYKDGWQSLIVELKPKEVNLQQLKQGSTHIFDGTMKRIYQSNIPTTSSQWCTTIFVSYYHCTGTGQCASGTCDECNQCVSTESYRICGTDPIEAEPYYISIGSSTPGGGTGDGSTSGSNNTIPESDDEISINPNLENLGEYFEGAITSLPLTMNDFQSNIDNTLTVDNTLPNINNLNDFNDFLVGINTQGTDFEYNQEDPNQKTSSTKFWIAGFFGGIKANIEQNMAPTYSISEVNSNAFGLTAGFSWAQSSYDTTIVGNVVTINIFGVVNYNLFVDGVGTVFSSNMQFRIKINKTNGNIISAIRVN